MSLRLISTSLVAFYSTTIDDFAVMIIFFGQANKMPNVWLGYFKVILGQTMAFTIVVLISLLGLVLGVFIPTEYINLIGVIPLYIGLQKAKEDLWDAESDDGEGSTAGSVGDAQSAAPDEETGIVTAGDSAVTSYTEDKIKAPQVKDSPVATASLVSAEGASRTYFQIANNDNELMMKSRHATGCSDITTEEAEEPGQLEEGEPNALSDFFKRHLAHSMDPFVLEVMVYGLICSSDNIVIYMTIYATLSPRDAALLTSFFYIMLMINILGAIVLMRCSRVGQWFEEHSKYIVPVLLIGLGVYILADSVLWPTYWWKYV